MNIDENLSEEFDVEISPFSVYQNIQTPEIEQHERVSKIEFLKSQLNEDTSEFLELLLVCPKEFIDCCFKESGIFDIKEFKRLCVYGGLSLRKFNRFMKELRWMYDMI